MTFKEFLLTGKKGRVIGSRKITKFGLVEEDVNGDFQHKVEGEPDVKLSHTDVLLGEWEAERLPRTFYLGYTKIQSHLVERKILQALDPINGAAPPGNDMFGNTWIKVVEVLD